MWGLWRPLAVAELQYLLPVACSYLCSRLSSTSLSFREGCHEFPQGREASVSFHDLLVVALFNVDDVVAVVLHNLGVGINEVGTRFSYSSSFPRFSLALFESGLYVFSFVLHLAIIGDKARMQVKWFTAAANSRFSFVRCSMRSVIVVSNVMGCPRRPPSG